MDSLHQPPPVGDSVGGRMLKQLFRRIHFTGVFKRDEKEMASICEKGEENLHGAMDILSSIHLWYNVQCPDIAPEFWKGHQIKVEVGPPDF